MAQIVAAALASHAPLITGRPEVAKPDHDGDLVRPEQGADRHRRQHVMKEQLTDEDLAGHDLTDAERAALRAGDITSLYHLGASPYLIRRVFRASFRT